MSYNQHIAPYTQKKYTLYAKLTSLMATIMESKQGLTIKGELKILRKYYLMLKVQ
jgi:hypothetical protein